jgi:hypothetical protein
MQHGLNREIIAALESQRLMNHSTMMVLERLLSTVTALQARIDVLEQRLEAVEARPRFVVHGGGKQ